MPHQIERKLAFQPRALNDLARAFESAWLELCAWGVEVNTEEQHKRIRTKLAQRIMECATVDNRFQIEWTYRQDAYLFRW